MMIYGAWLYVESEGCDEGGLVISDTPPPPPPTGVGQTLLRH